MYMRIKSIKSFYVNQITRNEYIVSKHFKYTHHLHTSMINTECRKGKKSLLHFEPHFALYGLVHIYEKGGP